MFKNTFLPLGKTVGISHTKRLTEKKILSTAYFFYTHFSMHINEMFSPSLDCFIRTGSTDPRGHIHFHPFNAGTQFSLICWFWNHPPAGFFFRMKCCYVTTTSFIVMFLLKFYHDLHFSQFEKRKRSFIITIWNRLTQLFSTSEIWWK